MTSTGVRTELFRRAAPSSPPSSRKMATTQQHGGGERDESTNVMMHHPSLAQRVVYLSQRALPQALETLSTRHESLLKIVQYLEGNYLLAVHNKGDRGPIEKEAKLYLNEALTRIAADIDNAAANLEQYLRLECSSVDALAQQVATLQTKLQLSKEAGARVRLDTFVSEKTQRVTHSNKNSSNEDDRLEDAYSSRVIKLPPHQQQASRHKLTLEEHTPANVARSRVPLHERLARLDAVGTQVFSVDEKKAESTAASVSSTPFKATPHIGGGGGGGGRTVRGRK